jgi:hypothetical protein
MRPQFPALGKHHVGGVEVIDLGNDLPDVVLFKLGFEEFDELIAWHGVQLNALVGQEGDLLGRTARLDQSFIGDLGPSRIVALEIHFLDVIKSQTEVDHIEWSREGVPPRVGVQRMFDDHAGTVEVVEN